MNFQVREMERQDIDRIADYWLSASDEQLLQMGVDIAKRPGEEQLVKMLRAQLDLPITDKQSYCLIWLINNEPVGHCNTNPTTFGISAYMHLHHWHQPNRKRGFGTELVKLSLPYFFNNLQLQQLISQPYAFNHAPNKTLDKVGFTFIKEYITVPGAINFEQPVNEWLLTRARFFELYS